MTDIADVRERLARVETKLDMLLDSNRHKRAGFISIISIVVSGLTTALVTVATRQVT